MNQSQRAANDRASARESIFVLCDLGRMDGRFIAQARVRNISPVGMMADVAVPMQTGETIIVAFRNAESVYATVSWARRGQVGVAFHTEVDPKSLRRPLSRSTTAATEFTALDQAPTFQA